MVLDLSLLPLAFRFQSPGPTVGPLPIRWYGLLIASALIIGITLSQNLAKKRNINPELISDLSIWLVIGAIPAARLYYVIFQWSEYAKNPAKIFAIWEGGIAIHGAMLGAIIAAIIFCKLKQISFWQIVDLIAPSAILGQAIGRWGNFFNSEAYGSPIEPDSNIPWKLFIPRDRRPLDLINYEYFHPTFLYESLWNLGVFTLLIFLFARSLQGKLKLKPGTLFLVYFATYSLGRVWIEALRTDSLMLGWLKMAQVVSITGIGLGLAGLWWLYIAKRPLPDVVSETNTETEKQEVPD